MVVSVKRRMPTSNVLTMHGARRFQAIQLYDATAIRRIIGTLVRFHAVLNSTIEMLVHFPISVRIMRICSVLMGYVIVQLDFSGI